MPDFYNGYVTQQWDDLRVSLENTKINPLTSKPDYDTFKGNTKAHLFDPTSVEGVTFAVQMPHSWVEGTDIRPHVHWCPVDTGTGTVIWKLDYTMADIDGTFGDTQTIEISDDADGTAYKHQKSFFPAITMAGKKISTMIACYLYRGADSDTYASDVAGLEFDIHFLKNSLGTSTPGAK